MNDLRTHFRPEFLNRLDEMILFKPLTKENIGKYCGFMHCGLKPPSGRPGVKAGAYRDSEGLYHRKRL